jgi:hypothetical protein
MWTRTIRRLRKYQLYVCLSFSASQGGTRDRSADMTPFVAAADIHLAWGLALQV